MINLPFILLCCIRSSFLYHIILPIYLNKLILKSAEQNPLVRKQHRLPICSSTGRTFLGFLCDSTDFWACLPASMCRGLSSGWQGRRITVSKVHKVQLSLIKASCLPNASAASSPTFEIITLCSPRWKMINFMFNLNSI